MKSVKTRPVRAALPAVSRYSSKVLTGLAQRTKYVDPALAERWRSLVGDELASLARPGRLTGGRTGRTLEVIAQTAAAAARVNFDAETIRRKVNTYLGPDTVGRITVLIRSGGQSTADIRDGPDGPSGDTTNAPSPPLGSALSRFRASVTQKARSEPDDK